MATLCKPVVILCCHSTSVCGLDSMCIYSVCVYTYIWDRKLSSPTVPNQPEKEGHSHTTQRPDQSPEETTSEEIRIAHESRLPISPSSLPPQARPLSPSPQSPYPNPCTYNVYMCVRCSGILEHNHAAGNSAFLSTNLVDPEIVRGPCRA